MRGATAPLAKSPSWAIDDGLISTPDAASIQAPAREPGVPHAKSAMSAWQAQPLHHVVALMSKEGHAEWKSSRSIGPNTR